MDIKHLLFDLGTELSNKLSIKLNQVLTFSFNYLILLLTMCIFSLLIVNVLVRI